MPYDDDFDPETGEILARNALGLDSDGPRFTALNPELVQDAYLQLGYDHADKYAASSLLEELRKGVRARLYLGYRKAGKSASDANEAAECHPEYQNHLRDMTEARRQADRARARMQAFDAARDVAKASTYAEGKAMRM